MAASEWITSKEAAKLLGVNPDTLSMWHRERRGPPHFAVDGRLRTLRRYRRADVIDFIAAMAKE
jgi:DNA-binding transcriptional MerR regulator